MQRDRIAALAGFLSTPSARRATRVCRQNQGNQRFLSTPSARRATKEENALELLEEISIHALREEGDPNLQHFSIGLFEFLSTPSARRATAWGGKTIKSYKISIHALREEGDFRSLRPSLLAGLFLSTPSARRATASGSCARASRSNFYPRPPRGGRRLVHLEGVVGPEDFYPRPPRGGRPLYAACARRAKRISIHALREEGDPMRFSVSTPQENFYPRPPRGGRLLMMSMPIAMSAFLSTPSARRATSCRVVSILSG